MATLDAGLVAGAATTTSLNVERYVGPRRRFVHPRRLRVHVRRRQLPRRRRLLRRQRGRDLGTASLLPGMPYASISLALPAGVNSISVVYQGDQTFAGSASPSHSITVAKYDSSVSFDMLPWNLAPGQSVTLTASVSSSSGPAPVGSLKFFDGQTLSGHRGPLKLRTGKPLRPSPRAITPWPLSTTETPRVRLRVPRGRNVGVQRYQTSTLLSTDNGYVNAGDPITLTATVSSYAMFYPSGPITIKDGELVIATLSLPANSNSCRDHTAPRDGTHSLTASFGGNAAFDASTSGAVSQVVNAVVVNPVVVMTWLSADATSAPAGQPVTFTMNIYPLSGSTPPAAPSPSTTTTARSWAWCNWRRRRPTRRR